MPKGAIAVYLEIMFHFIRNCQTATDQNLKYWKQQNVGEYAKKLITHTQLVGMQKDTVTLENSLKVGFFVFVFFP